MAGPEPRCPAPTRDATSGARPAPPDKRRRAEPRALFRRAAQDGGHAGGTAPPRGGHGAWARPAPGLLRAGGCHPAWVGPAGAGEWLRRRQEACERAGGPGVQGGAPATSQEPGPGAGVGAQRGPGGVPRPEPFVMPSCPPADRAGLPEAAHDLPEQEAGAAGRGRQGEAPPLLQEHRPRLQDSQGGKARPSRSAWAGSAASAPLLGLWPGQPCPESCGGPAVGLCGSARGLGLLRILNTITEPLHCLDCLTQC